MPTYRLQTLGCKVNQYETEAIARELESAGYTAAGDHEEADVCIVSTCTVTQKASMQSRQATRQAVRGNPGARVFVTGCYAQTEPDEISKIGGIHKVVGQMEKHRLPDMIISPGPDTLNSEDVIHMPDGLDCNFPSPPLPATGSRSRPYLKIQDGCNAFCTYCIVPYARGRSRSMPVKNIFSYLDKLKANGFNEVVLSGIHLGYYGADLDPETDLSSLVHDIIRENRIERLRLSSIEPMELKDDIIRLAAEPAESRSRLCRHFHVPLQSGDDGILDKMGRPYTSQHFEALVNKIRSWVPDAGIGADVIVGFPGESDEAFENTYRLIERLPVTYLHVFPFSPRKGTAAWKFSGRIPAPVIKERAKRLRELGLIKKSSFYKSMRGERLEVLVEGKRDSGTGLLKGISSNYIPVWIEGSDQLMNRLVQVRIESLKNLYKPLAVPCG